MPSSPPPTTAPPIVMRICRAWDVKCPPAKKHMIAGKLVPTVKGVFGGRIGVLQKNRRLTIEIHGPEQTPQEQEAAAVSAAPKQRGLSRSHRADSNPIDLSNELMDDDRIWVRIWKPRKAWGFSRDPDDSSDSEGEGETSLHTYEDDDNHDAWVEYRKIGIDELEDESISRNSWEATMGLGTNQEHREIRFETDEQANEFKQELDKLRAHVKERAQARLIAFQSSRGRTSDRIQQMVSRSQLTGLDATSDIQLLVEIVSATDLPIADRKSTDPYVIVYMGKQEIHRTKPIHNSVNPVWTVDNGSLFIMSASAEEFFSNASGLTFVLKDYDALSSNEVLFKLEVAQADLLALDGGRTSFNLQIIQPGKFLMSSKYFQPKLHLRVRPAESEDRKFMKQVFAIQKSKKLGIYADSSFVAPKAERMGLLKRENKMMDGIQLSRIKPHPDPRRDEGETKWMAGKAIMEEALKPTHNWVEAGTGGLGKLYLEVIKCDSLPNIDSGLSGVTDAFCCIIYEDAIVNTDVINDELSPRWVPWCQRGFVFRMAHPSSQVLIGVFDYDSAKGFNSHDPIGRVSIDVTNFRRETDYLLTYDLYRSVLDNERETFGTITVRLRLEYDSYRDFVRSSALIPPLNYINLPKKAGFRASYFVCNGEENLERFDMCAITAYKAELESYMDILHYVTQSLVTIVLWRGHCDIKLFSFKFKLPLHSMIAFSMGIFLIDNFNLLPSFWLFSIAWIFLAINEHRQKNPSPWHQTMTYAQMWHAVLANEAQPVEIADHENEAAIRAHEQKEKERQEQKAAKAKEAAERANKLNDFLNEEAVSASGALEDEDRGTKIGGGPVLNPLAPVLLPIQKILGRVCKTLRIISSILSWNENIYAFIIVNICLALGIALIWVPWGFLLRWTIRILIWVCLGPWMKLVDIFYVSKIAKEGEDASEVFKKLAEAKFEAVGTARDIMMRKKEEITKLRVMKRFMFGQFVTRVPRLKEHRYTDIPRAESSATPVRSYHPVVISKKLSGQTLVGNMIPTWGDAVDASKEEKEE